MADLKNLSIWTASESRVLKKQEKSSGDLRDAAGPSVDPSAVH